MADYNFNNLSPVQAPTFSNSLEPGYQDFSSTWGQGIPAPTGSIPRVWGDGEIQNLTAGLKIDIPKTGLALSSGNFFGGNAVLANADDATLWQQGVGFKDQTGKEYGGFAMPTIQAGTALFGAYNGFQNMKNAQNALAFQKDAFSKQFENQRTLVNNDLRDRDATRSRRDPSYQSNTKFV